MRACFANALEPFIPNTGGLSSKALCLLFKFGTLHLTAKQLHGLLRHENVYVAPHIAILRVVSLKKCFPCPLFHLIIFN
jgi:hypothetical protein